VNKKIKMSGNKREKKREREREIEMGMCLIQKYKS